MPSIYVLEIINFVITFEKKNMEASCVEIFEYFVNEIFDYLLSRFNVLSWWEWIEGPKRSDKPLSLKSSQMFPSYKNFS